MEKVTLKCNKCGKMFKVSPKAADPDCPKCGGVDWDVVSPALPTDRVAFERFMVVHEPASGWYNQDDAVKAYMAWRTR